MFDPQTVTMAVGILAALSISGLAYALLSPLMDRQDKKDRINKVAVVDRRAVHARQASAEDAANRRKNIASKLKQQQQLIDEKTKNAGSSKATLEMRLKRAGLTWNKRSFLMISATCGLVIVGALMSVGAPLYASIAGGIAGAFGLPNWYVNFKGKSRMKKFLLEFPNAIDVIVRGMKAGLPLNDCMLIISREAAEPVRGEFKQLVEQQQMGVQLNDAVAKMYERVPLPEVNFLSIMMAIQGQSGGNLSEPLGNLSRVVRDRKKMKAKIDAMSMEAKSSAAIIACLPVAVITLIYLSTPDYITLLFTERLGNLLLGACGILMLTGVLVMRKMINFDI
ncbi:MAG: type II secretion system F family protein [Rhizobiales bacterium]|nr:type II secretion system F family protein [Hyphomicrobiales bacterium]MBO6699212.1 type II secretion system F family protein [Hyphomicrobiales bacterium]MBO6736750.1 type II secretion system F family protein [Hyphomicrobiales bacterium]MBO6912176.1 type II secretion system F family protein [Hyphomicrobiales bacterium]MBO6956671.1 type II secretion system F family protein [Hyphomicrobiales bacterium]